MGLQSNLFKGDPKLEACAVKDSAHISKRENFVGEHVGKIQTALIRLDPTLKIDPNELATKTYGPSTADAVLAFKRARSIINVSYQTEADNIVGKMTIVKLDKEMQGNQSRLIAKDLAAFDKPSAEGLVRNALSALRDIEKDISILESGASLSLGTPRWNALQTHFHLNFQVTTGTARALTKADLAFIRRNYLAVANVFNNSVFAFENGPSAKPGSPASGSFDKQKIFFAPLYKDFDTPDGKAIGPRSRAAILVHEAVHLTDNLSGDDATTHISEFDSRYETQSADNAIHNASSYATFAWHVTRGFDRPRFGLGPARGI